MTDIFNVAMAIFIGGFAGALAVFGAKFIMKIRDPYTRWEL